MYKIGEFSKMTQVSVRMLRYYEECGLIEPIHNKKENGYRFYNIDQLETIAKIRSFLSMSFTTDEIKILLKSNNLKDALENKLATIQNELAQKERNLQLINFYLETLEDVEFNQDYRAYIKTISSQNTATRRMILPDALTLPEEWTAFLTALEESGSKVMPYPGGFTKFHDKEYTLENSDVEMICFLEKRGRKSNAFEYKTLNSFTALSVIHNGSYEFLNEAYAFAYKWLYANGYKAIDYPYECHLKNAFDTKNENEFITELLLPIEPV